MARKSEAVAQKKDNEILLWIPRILSTLILFVVVYSMWFSICTPWNFPLLVLAFIILFIIAIVLKSPPLLDAVLLLVIIFSMLFTLGTFCPSIPLRCEFPVGIVCVQSKLWVNTGKLTLEIGQATGKTINVTGVTCTMNNSPTYTSAASIIYSPATDPIQIPSGTKAFVAGGPNAPSGINNVICTDANGNLPSDTKIIGAPYNGWIYISYTEMDTNLTKTTTGVFTARHEA